MLTALATAGCASAAGVSSHVQRGIDFAQYRTYAWGPPDALPTGDPRLDQNPFFQDHVQGAAEKQLAARGLELAASGAPGLLLHYHANVSQRLDVNRIDQAYGYCTAGDCPSDLIEYEAGTLVLDVMDARTGRLVWRGWVANRLHDMIDNPDRMAAAIEDAVTRLLSRFPRSVAK